MYKSILLKNFPNFEWCLLSTRLNQLEKLPFSPKRFPSAVLHHLHHHHPPHTSPVHRCMKLHQDPFISSHSGIRQDNPLSLCYCSYHTSSHSIDSASCVSPKAGL